MCSAARPERIWWMKMTAEASPGMVRVKVRAN